MDVFNRFEASMLKHLGATHKDSADQWPETKRRIQSGFLAVKRVAKYWSLGTGHGRGIGAGPTNANKLRVMRSVIEGTLLACGNLGFGPWFKKRKPTKSWLEVSGVVWGWTDTV